MPAGAEAVEMAAVAPESGVAAVFTDATGKEVAVEFVQNLLLEMQVSQGGRDGGEPAEDKVEGALLEALADGFAGNDAADIG